jgi:hypothetical protein
MSARVERAAEARARAVAVRLAGAAERALPGVSVRAEDDRVVLEGRGLARRALDEPALRWPGGLLR